MWQLVQSFYSNLDEHNRQMVNTSCGGSFLYKTPEEVWELFEHLSTTRKEGLGDKNYVRGRRK